MRKTIAAVTAVGALTAAALLTPPVGYADPIDPWWKALFPTSHQLTVRRGNHFPMCDDPDLVASEVKHHVRGRRLV
jgi:haloalkane dehalogenase